jgi:hypothetical protein
MNVWKIIKLKIHSKMAISQKIDSKNADLHNNGTI